MLYTRHYRCTCLSGIAGSSASVCNDISNTGEREAEDPIPRRTPSLTHKSLSKRVSVFTRIPLEVVLSTRFDENKRICDMNTHRTPVYVLNKKGKPLDPTFRYGHVRRLLKDKKAVPVSNEPFTIRLKYDTPDKVMGVYGGLDPGRENIGLAASDSRGKGVYLSDVRTNNKSVKSNMADRAGFRRSRRRHDRQSKQRKAIHDGTTIKNGSEDKLRTKRDCRSVLISYPGADAPVTHKVIRGKEGKFNNRKRPEGWITPSARQLVQVTMSSVKRMAEILPLKELHVERVSFDFQKLENGNVRPEDFG